MMMTPLRESKPSISASSWLSVCSRSSWLPIGLCTRDLAERVELVDEDDARRLGLGLLEQIAHARGADADEHLDELRPAQAEERHAWPRRRRRAPAASCRCPAGRPAARPSGCARRAFVYFFGFFRNSTISLQLVLGLVHAGHVGEAAPSRRRRRRSSRGCGRTTSRRPRRRPSGGRRSSRRRRAAASGRIQPSSSGSQRLTTSPVYLTLLRLELLDELRILDARRGERSAAAGPSRRLLAACRGSSGRRPSTSATWPLRSSALNSL